MRKLACILNPSSWETLHLGQKLLIEVSERKSKPKCHLFIYYIESYLNEPPGRLKVSTEEKYQHFQPNLAKKIPVKKTDINRTHRELTEHYLNRQQEEAMLATCSCSSNCLETNRNFHLTVPILKHLFSFNGVLMIHELCWTVTLLQANTRC